MATPIPKNQASFSLPEIAQLTEGEPRGGDPNVFSGVVIDSRLVVPGNVFVAIRGETHDGHDYAKDAAERGAKVIVADRNLDGVPASVAVVRVDDTTAALGRLARGHRTRWATRRRTRRRLFGLAPAPPRVVALTGSAGKTTTRNAVAALLSHLGLRVHASAGNLNNAIGIPMVLFGLEPHHDIAVVEVGTNHPGEIAYGASLCLPDVAMVTLVDLAHSEGIGSIDDIATEKGSLLAALPRSGVAIVNGDDARARAQLFRSQAAHWLTVGSHALDLDVRIQSRRPIGIKGSDVTVQIGGGASMQFKTPLLGDAGAQACAMAVAAAAAVRPGVLSSDDLTRGFDKLANIGDGRLSPERLVDGTILIDDAYNANGASTVASVRCAMEIAREMGHRAVVVLGEMLELGSLADQEHDRVGATVVAENPDAVVAVQGRAKRILRIADSANIDGEFFASAQDAAARIREFVRPGDLVLVKGSNSVGLSTVVEALRKSAKPIGGTA